MRPWLAPWYINNLQLFKNLVGPLLLAASGTSQRQRATLDLLLTTLITPWQMLWGKLLSGLRVSSVLTSFLMWPVFLACIMPLDYWNNLPTMAGYFLIFGLTCVTTSMTALFCSTLFRKSATSLMATYVIIVALFLTPMAAEAFVRTFARGTAAASIVEGVQVTSPFAAAFNLPLTAAEKTLEGVNVRVFLGFVGFSVLYNVALLLVVMQLFRMRWKIFE
jgi:ABC-type transport system involved in multi-copper enzyme maturation permease subunit